METLDKLKRASKLVRLTFRKNGPKSFKKGQGALLNALLEHDGATQRELVDVLSMSRRDLKDVVKKAERNGFATMEDVDAERTYAVKLTDEGRSLAQKRAAANDRTAEEIVSCLTQEEKAQLNAIADKLIAATEEQGVSCRKKGRSSHRCHCKRHRR